MTILSFDALFFIYPQEKALAVMMMFRRRMCPPLVKGSLTRTIWDRCCYRSAWGQFLWGQKTTTN